MEDIENATVDSIYSGLPSHDGESFNALVRSRRSIRGFQPSPVPEAVLTSIFRTAQWSPSNCNVQPWKVHVLSGNAIERMRRRFISAALAEEPHSPDVKTYAVYPGKFRDRQIGSAKALFSATQIERTDVEGRRRSLVRNYEFFGAPHVAFFFMPQWGGFTEASNVGMFAQTLVLAMTAHGIGSCIQGAAGHYANIVHEECKIDDDLLLLFGISFGFEDEAHPANGARTDRVDLDESVVFWT